MTREEAIKRLRGILTEAVEFENSVCYVTEEDREPLEMAIEALENQKTGHWERKYNIYTLEHWYKCSECGDCSDYKTPYCSDCGAKMKGETNDL